ncbi:MAG: DUF3696 domain-containing protein [Pseudomonadota bacterium]
MISLAIGLCLGAWPQRDRRQGATVKRLGPQGVRLDVRTAHRMLTSLTLRNFKCWQGIEEMRLAPITGLFGTNSSGKSAIIQSLLLLKQTKESTDRAQFLNFGDSSTYVSLGTFKDAIHNHEVSAALSWRLEWSLDKPIVITDPNDRRVTPITGDRLAFAAKIVQNEKGVLQAPEITYDIAGCSFSLDKVASSGDHKLAVHPDDRYRFKRAQGRPWALPGPIKFYGFPDQVRAYYQNAGFLADLQLAFERQLDRIFYLGPLRESPKREYPWAGGAPDDVGRRGELAVAALLAARSKRQTIGQGKGKRRSSVEAYVARWLFELGLIWQFSIEEIAAGSNLYKVRVRNTLSAPEVLITDVGVGVSQVLPVLILLYYVPEGSTVLLEQPEIHLHPLAQSKLADIFIEAVKVRRLQVIVESHSEHLLRRLQRRLAEEEFSVDQAALYLCDVDRGAAALTPLELDLFGNIKNWPKHFFGDDFGEIAAMEQAAIKRKINAAE